MLGGSDVVNSSRCHIGNLDVRDRLWRRLWIIISHTSVTDAITHADDRRAVVVRHDSGWRRIARE
jgi:hypothetical protein